MRTNDKSTRTLVAAVALLTGALLLLTASCEDSAVVAPPDGQIILNTSSPVTSTDPSTGEEITTTPVLAQVLDMSNFPQAGVDVIFFTTGGTLTSGTAMSTDVNGVAQDNLILRLSDPQMVTVTCQSGGLSATVEVRNTLTGNALPIARIVETPAGEQEVDTAVLFDGADPSDPSSDPDGDAITCFEWQINANSSCVSSPATGTCRDGVAQNCVYGRSSVSVLCSQEQTMTVTLAVSDDPGALASCNSLRAPPPGTVFSPDEASLSYTIICNEPPTANAGPAIARQLLVGETTVTVQQDGSLSRNSDNTTTGLTYEWQCASTNNTVMQGAQVDCVYGLGVHTAELTVTHTENGCITTDTDTVTVTVTDAPSIP